MNRRAFITAITAGILLPRLRQPHDPDATPPSGSRPAPIDLGEGLTLVDYRVYPGDRPAIIGELRSDRDEMVDAPVVSLTWPDASRSAGFTWASPLIPVIEPGGSIPIFGPLPESGEAEPSLDSARFALCSPVERGEYTRSWQSLNVDFRMTHERYRHAAFKGTGIVANPGPGRTPSISVRGIVRDGDDRIAGVTSTPSPGVIPPGEEREFTVWIAASLRNKANPVPLISGLDYSVDIRPGVRGPAIAPGCAFGKPWD